MVFTGAIVIGPSASMLCRATASSIGAVVLFVGGLVNGAPAAVVGGVVLAGVAAAAFRVRAIVDDDRLDVRNPLRSYRIRWSDVAGLSVVGRRVVVGIGLRRYQVVVVTTQGWRTQLVATRAIGDADRCNVGGEQVATMRHRDRIEEVFSRTGHRALAENLDIVTTQAEGELLKLVRAQLAAVLPFDCPHPRTGERQDIWFDEPRIEMHGGRRVLVVTLRDLARPHVVYGYRVTLADQWAAETPPAMLASPVTGEICEIIEAASIGLPLDARAGEVCWLEETTNERGRTSEANAGSRLLATHLA